jgi:exoribonuclease R
MPETLQSALVNAIGSLKNNIFPIEKAMQNLYNSRIANRSRPPSQQRYTLTKKQIPKIASQCSNPPQLEELLRNLFKVGEDRLSRLVDSALATDYLYTDFCRDGDNERLMRRMVAAQVLTEDAVLGGRFKRRSCQFVGAQYSFTGDDEDIEVEQVTLVNGGWIAVDPSIKSRTEGRKFASLSQDDLPQVDTKKSDTKSPRVLTAADERIAHRLECLAMGDIWNDVSDRDDEERALELDVREALSSMDLPLTSEGATNALIRIGRWSQSSEDNKRKKVFEPWSPDILEAARALAMRESRRREHLAKICVTAKNNKTASQSAPSTDDLEGRANLCSLPCVCIDAKRASFRDDSVGIRLRSSTGRKVNKAASKWEVLIHIADVSDLYFGQEFRGGEDLSTDVLRRAAERRGQSRYDLPLGPLHLLPPVALEALALATNVDGLPNRCVTLWAYIDERDGKLLDAGLERTIISSPKALSFAEATSLLECNIDDTPQSLTNAKSIISVAERNLSLWNRRHRQRNEAARKRESRLATRELVASELKAAGGQSRDDGVGGSFQRSRGHRLVDSSLDLYAYAVGTMMKRANQPIPRAAGSGADRGGRLATAPLRRYIDGLAQRQALSVLCDYGSPLTSDECHKAAKAVARATDNIANLRSSKNRRDDSPRDRQSSGRQVSALHTLNRYLASTGGGQYREVKAISSGKNNECVIVGAGATGRVIGVSGTLKGGEKLLVEIIELDPERGVLDVRIV